jgi:hypothetical protein
VNLNEIQNLTLANLQQSELLNTEDFTEAPNWSDATNPGILQPFLTTQINRSYMRVIQDLADIQIALYRWVFASIAQVSDYPLPPLAPPQNTLWGSSVWGSAQLGAGAPQTAGIWGQGSWGQMQWGTQAGPPNIQRITRVVYGPIGQPWLMDFEGGVRLVSWQQFMRQSAFGYLRPFCYNIIPDYCAVSPDRKILSFFPGSADAGDTIGVEYVPELTPNSEWPPLMNGTDVPQIPDPTHDLIVLWATYLCCPKLKMFPLMQEMKMAYHGQTGHAGELGRIRDVLRDRSTGDTLRIRDANEGIYLSYPMTGLLAP